jgi:aconitase B
MQMGDEITLYPYEGKIINANGETISTFKLTPNTIPDEVVRLQHHKPYPQFFVPKYSLHRYLLHLLGVRKYQKYNLNFKQKYNNILKLHLIHLKMLIKHHCVVPKVGWNII